MPPWFIDIESATEIEAKSNGTPPASRTPAQASRASAPSSALQGVTRPSVEATPTNGRFDVGVRQPQPAQERAVRRAIEALDRDARRQDRDDFRFSGVHFPKLF